MLPIGTNWIKDTLYVTYVAKDWLDEVPLGSRIVSINGLSSEKYFERHIYPYVSAKTLQDKRKNPVFIWNWFIEGYNKYIVYNPKTDMAA